MSIKPLLIVLLVMLARGFHSFGQTENYLLAFTDSSSENNLVGYKNQEGEIVIPAKYRETLFDDTLRRINYTAVPEFGSDQENLITNKPFIYCGKISNPPSRENYWYWKGHVFMNVVDGKIGFINAADEQVIRPKYDFVSPFKNGIAHYYIGGQTLFYDDAWYWDGYFTESGYINKQGQEYSDKTVLYRDGYLKTITYRWSSPDVRSMDEMETFEFYKSGKLKMHVTNGVNLYGSENHNQNLTFDENGDTVHIENRINGKLDGEYRWGHPKYHVDSTGAQKLYDWESISSVWKDGVLIDFISNDLIFLGKRYNEISERKMIRMINSGKFEWWYSYIDQDVVDKSGQEFNFLIHKKPFQNDNTNHVTKRKLKIVKRSNKLSEKQKD